MIQSFFYHNTLLERIEPQVKLLNYEYVGKSIRRTQKIVMYENMQVRCASMCEGIRNNKQMNA
jgi:hypothetical protein